MNIRKLALHDEALNEFVKLTLVDRPLARRIVLFLEELAGDQSALDKMADDKYANEDFNVAGIKSWWKECFPAFRIRALKAAPSYRIFYAPVETSWVILSVQKRRSDLYEDKELLAKLKGRLDEYKRNLP